MSHQWLKARQTKYATYATIYILVVVAIIVVANVLANRYNKSFDTTANQRFSFSGQTQKVVKELTQDVNILYFGRKPFPEAKQLLGRYTDLSSKIHVEYIDFESNPLIVKANNVIRPDTAVIQIGERKQQARSLTEEEITGALIRTLKDKVRTLCFLTGSGEHSLEDTSPEGYAALKEPLEKEGYKTESISLLEKAEIPGECTVVVVGGPQRDYPQSEVDSLQAFVERGGRLLAMLDAPLKAGRLNISDNTALVNMFQQWGVVLEKDFILDPTGERIGAGAYVTIVETYTEQPVVRDLSHSRIITGFPYARSLQTAKSSRARSEAIALSTELAVASTKFDSGEISRDDPSLKHGPFTIAAAGAYRTGLKNAEGRFVVFGSSQWASNQFVTQPSLGNAILSLNTMDWLASDEDIIAIPAKAPDDRPVTMNLGQMTWVLLTSLGLIPFAAIIAGIAVWVRRR